MQMMMHRRETFHVIYIKIGKRPITFPTEKKSLKAGAALSIP